MATSKKKPALSAAAAKKYAAKPNAKGGAKGAAKTAAKPAKKTAAKGAVKSAASKKTTAAKQAAKKPAAKTAAKAAAKSAKAMTSAKAKAAASQGKVSAKAKGKAGKAAKAPAGKASSDKTSAGRAKAPTLRLVQGNKSETELRGLFVPLEDRVLVEPAGVSDRTSGGLYIPEVVQERPMKGKVVAVGKGKRLKKGMLRPLDLKVGDHVIYAQFAGTQLELAGREVLLLREDEVLGVIKP